MNTYLQILKENLNTHFVVTTDYSMYEETFNIHAIMKNSYDRPNQFIPARTTNVLSCETVLAKCFENFTKENFEYLTDILKQYENDYELKNQPNHTYTFLSLYIFTDNIDNDVLKLIKKFKFELNYKKNAFGFLSTRLCVVDTTNNKKYTNTFGKDIVFRIN